MTNKVEKSIKKKKSMVVKTGLWIIMGLGLGFLVTFGLSTYNAYKDGLVVVLTNLANEYFSLVLEIANRSSSLANLILHDDLIAEAQIYQHSQNAGQYFMTNLVQINPDYDSSTGLSPLFLKLKYYGLGIAYLVRWSLKVDVLKFISVFCSFMVFVFAAFLGLLDGLLTRYIRTAEGGRESTYIYHRLADVVFKVPFILALVYLVLPLPLDPLVMVLILAVFTFLFFRISASNLKKFI